MIINQRILRSPCLPIPAYGFFFLYCTLPHSTRRIVKDNGRHIIPNGLFQNYPVLLFFSLTTMIKGNIKKPNYKINSYTRSYPLFILMSKSMRTSKPHVLPTHPFHYSKYKAMIQYIQSTLSFIQKYKAKIRYVQSTLSFIQRYKATILYAETGCTRNYFSNLKKQPSCMRKPVVLEIIFLT